MIPKTPHRRTAPNPISATPIAKIDLAPKKRGMAPRPIVDFPTPKSKVWVEPDTFQEALTLHMARHDDSAWHLYRAIIRSEDRFDRKTIVQWMSGKKAPRAVASMEMLARIEWRYRLPSGYFKAKLPHASRAATGHTKLHGIEPAERRRLAWHLPDDFDDRPAEERETILEWVRTVVISGATDYRRFQVEAMKHRYAIRFPELTGRKRRTSLNLDIEDEQLDDVELELKARAEPHFAALAVALPCKDPALGSVLPDDQPKAAAIAIFSDRFLSFDPSRVELVNGARHLNSPVFETPCVPVYTPV